MTRCLPFVVLLAGCGGDASIPTTNIEDYRVTFSTASASESCAQATKDEADSFEPYSLIYRVHWPEGADSNRVDLWWRAEGDSDSDFFYFASGSMQGELNAGSIGYAGYGLSERRTDGTVYFDIDGVLQVRFTDEISAGTESYTIVEPTNADGYHVGCVYTMEYAGNALNPAEG